MSDNLPDWIYEGAEVWVHQNRGAYGNQSPRPARVARFTEQRIMVDEQNLGEAAFSKDELRGIGSARNYTLLSPNDEKIITTLRVEAVSNAMNRLREIFRDMQLGGRIGWNELPDAQEAAEMFHDASYEALQAIEHARQRYGPGNRRDPRR